MLHLVYSPKWFYGEAILIDLVSVFVLALVAFFSLRYYKIKKNENYLYLAISFGILALSFIFKILMNFSMNYNEVETRQVGLMVLTYQTVESSDILFFLGFLLYRILTLVGLYVLYSLYHKQTKQNHFLIVSLLVALAYFSYSSYYVFHTVSFILLILILIQYLTNYVDKKHFSTILMTISFVTIAFSQILFILIGFNPEIYVAAELTQLIGYIGILTTFLTVLKSGYKKNKN